MNKSKEKYFKRVEKAVESIGKSVNELVSKERIKKRHEELRIKTVHLELTSEELHTLRNLLNQYANFVEYNHNESVRVIELYKKIIRQEKMIKEYNNDGTKRIKG